MPNSERMRQIVENMGVLANSTSPDELVAAAAELAASDDPQALDVLGTFLRRGEFLARLDDLEDPAQKTNNLAVVLNALIQRPSPEIRPLCLSLAQDPAFLADPDRKSFLLEALAGVVPMDAQTVEVFQQSNDEGYYGSNARLLVTNASPLALDLFAAMMSDKTVPAEERAECLHLSVVHNRIRLSILKMVERLISMNLENQVAEAAIESVFDYQVWWVKGHPPPPPSWRTASTEVLSFLIELGAQAKHRANLPEQIHLAINNTIETARALLARRAA